MANKKLDINKIRSKIRRLWMDHVIYTRLYMISLFSNSPDIDAVTKRLMSNQDEIGDMFSKVYGENAGSIISQLLKSHIVIAGDLMKAMMTINKEQAALEEKKWDDNAKSIAMYIGQLNPNLNTQALYDHLRQHLSLTKNEAISHLSKDYPNEIKAFDAAVNQGQDMADVLTAGILYQFPNNF